MQELEPVRRFLTASLDAVVLMSDIPCQDHARITFANDAFCKLFGHVPEHVVGTSAGALYDLETWRDLCSELELLRGSDTARFTKELKCLKSDGTAFWAKLCLARIPAHEGHAPYVSITFQDLSDLKAREDAADKAMARGTAAIAGHERLRLALDAYPDPFVLYDKDLQLLDWNTAYSHSMTLDPSALKAGMTLREVLELGAVSGFHLEARGRAEEWVNSILSQQTLTRETQDVELENGVHQRLMRYRSENGDYVVIRMNSTELVRQKRVAEEAEARLRSAINAYPHPFVIFDPTGCVLVWNDAYSAAMSAPEDPIRAGMHRNYLAYMAYKAGKLNQLEYKDVELPVQDLELPGDVHHRLLRSKGANGDLVIVRIDTTELVHQQRALENYAKQLEIANEEISHQAFHDELTGLGNRRMLARKFEEFEERQKTEGGEIAALHIDLDRFKQINDTLGHMAGDKVLLDVSARLLDCIDAEDVVARIGGDEFVVLIFAEEGSERYETLAKQLLVELSKPTDFDGKECRFGVSIGMANTPLTRIADLLTNSDVALYKAKRSGRGQLAIFDDHDLQEMRRQKDVADNILRGIEQGEFVPFYQPQVDAITQQVVGIEVLARWAPKGGKILSPDAFLDVAYDLDVVSKIDKMVFERALDECSTALSGLEQIPSLSFNVSASRVYTYDIAEITAHIRKYPGRVGFELLETIFLEEADTSFLYKLDQLREMDIDIEVDDFGSGRASVIALQKINPDRIKIDRRLVDPIDQSEAGLRLLRSIVEIGHALEMEVTAEGVETARQAELLAELGCDRLQGYYFSRPLSFDTLLAFLGLGPDVSRAEKAG